MRLVAFLLGSLPLTLAHNYTYHIGALAAGHDLQQSEHTLPEAITVCSGLSGCRGFTYHSTEKELNGTAKFYFKSSSFTNFDSTWSTYLRDQAPTPAPPPLLVNPCLNASSPAKQMQYCDATLPLATRVDDMVSRMSTAEKIGSLRDATSSIPSLDLPMYNW
jgi:hypothetical protein